MGTGVLFRVCAKGSGPERDKFGKTFPSERVPPRAVFAGGVALWLVALLLAPLTPRADSEPAGVPAAPLGDWYVLIHYRDTEASADAPRQWDDEIWRIEVEGAGLRWTLFPHPKFRDGSGRWETLPGGDEARSLGAWKPNGEQRKEIAAGLDYGLQDERSKRLKPAGKEAWASPGQPRIASASGVGYHERWRIEAGEPGLRFSRLASMASGRAVGMEAGTRFEARESLRQGRERRGEYNRDGERQGEFQMFLMGGRGQGRP